jgi:DNA-binding transcriptional regulator LsrR (DeoR family)
LYQAGAVGLVTGAARRRTNVGLWEHRCVMPTALAETPPRPGADDDAQASDQQVRAAWLYYVEGLTQQRIARVLRVSRTKVVRLLAAARTNGIVSIEVGGSGGEEVALERRLIDRFALDEARVVAGADERAAAIALAQAAGAWLGEQVVPGVSLGVGWGATLSMAAATLPARRVDRVSVVSLLGGMTHSRAVNPSAVARRVADAFGAKCYQLTAPLVVAGEAMRDRLWKEAGLSEVARRARAVDLAVVSVGDVSADATLFSERLLPHEERAALLGAGAVGDVLCQFLDATGARVDHPARARIVAFDLDALALLPRVAIVSGGERKVAALRAALAATRARVLVTDVAAARGLLAG